MRQAENGEISIRETLPGVERVEAKPSGMGSASASLLMAPVEIIPAQSQPGSRLSKRRILGGPMDRVLRSPAYLFHIMFRCFTACHVDGLETWSTARPCGGKQHFGTKDQVFSSSSTNPISRTWSLLCWKNRATTFSPWATAQQNRARCPKPLRHQDRLQRWLHLLDEGRENLGFASHVNRDPHPRPSACQDRCLGGGLRGSK